MRKLFWEKNCKRNLPVFKVLARKKEGFCMKKYKEDSIR